MVSIYLIRSSFDDPSLIPSQGGVMPPFATSEPLGSEVRISFTHPILVYPSAFHGTGLTIAPEKNCSQGEYVALYELDRFAVPSLIQTRLPIPLRKSNALLSSLNLKSTI